MKHSWVVGRGALALAKALNFSPDIIILSETPTLFAHPKLVADGLAQDPLFAHSKTIFNDHTPLEYAHPIWPERLLRDVRMDPAVFGPFLRNGSVDVTQLLVAISDGVFGVAKKHADVMRAMPSLAPYAKKIGYITNGVSRDFWQEPVFHAADQLSDTELLAAKDKLRDRFVDWLWRRALLWPLWTRAVKGKPIVLWTRRITSYKRLDLLEKIFDVPAWRQRFIDADVVLVVGGRVYQRDNVSEKMVYNLVERLNKDELLGERVVFLHNFNVWEAPRLFWGADGAIMLSDDGREASATGFMKSQMNGGVILANPDGAVPEFVFSPDSDQKAPNGFTVSYKDGQPDPESFLNALQSFGRAFRHPTERARLMRNALAMTPRVGVDRTAREMMDFYKTLMSPAVPTA
jgi:glucan phosphorylase